MNRMHMLMAGLLSVAQPIATSGPDIIWQGRQVYSGTTDTNAVVGNARAVGLAGPIVYSISTNSYFAISAQTGAVSVKYAAQPPAGTYTPTVTATGSDGVSVSKPVPIVSVDSSVISVDKATDWRRVGGNCRQEYRN